MRLELLQIQWMVHASVVMTPFATHQPNLPAYLILTDKCLMLGLQKHHARYTVIYYCLIVLELQNSGEHSIVVSGKSNKIIFRDALASIL